MTDRTALLRRGVWDNPFAVLPLASLSWAGNVIASRLAVGAVSPMA